MPLDVFRTRFMICLLSGADFHGGSKGLNWSALIRSWNALSKKNVCVCLHKLFCLLTLAWSIFEETYCSINWIRILNRTGIELDVPVIAIPADHCAFLVRVLANSYGSAHIRFVLHVGIVLIIQQLEKFMKSSLNLWNTEKRAITYICHRWRFGWALAPGQVNLKFKDHSWITTV